MKKRVRDKYGRGSVAANGEGFVDLAPGGAFEINKDAGSERTSRGDTAPLQNPVSCLSRGISYYVGDVNRTCPRFVAGSEMFSIETAARRVALMLDGASGVRKTDLAVIILQKNEKLHIKRCLEKLTPLAPRQIVVVDCYSTDGSDMIAAEMGATVVYRAWPGNQAAQFNWALDNLPIKASWILRLDADEYLYPETCEEVKRLVADGGLPPDVTSLSRSCFLRAQDPLRRNGAYPHGAVLQARHRALSRSGALLQS